MKNRFFWQKRCQRVKAGNKISLLCVYIPFQFCTVYIYTNIWVTLSENLNPVGFKTSKRRGQREVRFSSTIKPLTGSCSIIRWNFLTINCDVPVSNGFHLLNSRSLELLSFIVAICRCFLTYLLELAQSHILVVLKKPR